MLASIEQEQELPQVRWYLSQAGLHLLLPGGMFLTTSMRALGLLGYDAEHPGRALQKLVSEGDAVLIDLPAERGGVGPMLRLTMEEASALQREPMMPVGRGLKPVQIPIEFWGHA